MSIPDESSGLSKTPLRCGVGGLRGIGPHVYSRWLDADETALENRRPLAPEGPESATVRELVRYATLAASGHNTQPWLFSIHENSIDIHPDYARSLPAVDPDHRELWISLGCALENLITVARASGYGGNVIYPETTDFIRIHFFKNAPQPDARFGAMPRRQNTRSVYDGQAMPSTVINSLQTLPLEPGCSSSSSRAVPRLLWLRFNKKEAMATRDGLYTHCSGRLSDSSVGQLFFSSQNPEDQADEDAKLLRSSSGAVIISSIAEGKTAWVRTGRVYKRPALKFTTKTVRSAFLNQPIEVAAVRQQFRTAMGLGEARPQLLVRFGYADLLPNSLRRPVEEVLAGPLIEAMGRR